MNKFKLSEEQRASMDEFEKTHSVRHYDRQGKLMSMANWCEKFEDLEYKRVALYSGFLCRVSTVWLGLDHGYCNDKPLIFETMVFMLGKDVDCERYTSLEEAKSGHLTLVKAYAWRLDLFMFVVLKRLFKREV
jgi:hypothetical protein